MTINKITDKDSLTIKIEGILDTITSPQLEAEIKNLDRINELTLDFSDLEYISSAGLRAVLLAHKTMASKRGLAVINLRPAVKEIFDITGFSGIIDIR